MRHLPLFALVAWAGVIFLFSSFPNPPDAGGNEWQYEVAHVAEYLVFGALALVALSSYSNAPLPLLMALAWVLAVLYGMSDEFHQSFVPNRDANWLDVGLDAFGAAIGVALCAWLGPRSLASKRRNGAPRGEGAQRELK